MFGLFKKNPIEKLNSKYHQIMEKAMNAQRNGDIQGFADLSAEAEKVMSQIMELKSEDSK